MSKRDRTPKRRFYLPGIDPEPPRPEIPPLDLSFKACRIIAECSNEALEHRASRRTQ